jgi:hypothetical protein
VEMLSSFRVLMVYLTASKKPPKVQRVDARWDNINLPDKPAQQYQCYQVPEIRGKKSG